MWLESILLELYKYTQFSQMSILWPFQSRSTIKLFLNNERGLIVYDKLLVNIRYAREGAGSQDKIRKPRQGAFNGLAGHVCRATEAKLPRKPGGRPLRGAERPVGWASEFWVELIRRREMLFAGGRDRISHRCAMPLPGRSHGKLCGSRTLRR